MVILVCGGREYDDYDRLSEVLEDVVSWSTTGEIKIVNGGCRGADQMSSRWAKEHGIAFVEYTATDIIDHFAPDQGIVFPGGKGTEDMLCRLFRAGVNTWVVG